MSKKEDPVTEKFMHGCVHLILLAAGAAVLLVTLFIANWILS